MSILAKLRKARVATGEELDRLAQLYGVAREHGETDQDLRDRIAGWKIITVEEEDMSRKDEKRAEDASAILARAFEGGAFEAWAKNVWRRADRDACRAAARGMLGELADGLAIRIDVKARDVYKDLPDGALPDGDWEQAKDASLKRVFAVARKR